MTVADFILGPLDPPEHVLDFAATLLLDTLGVAAGAVHMEAGRITRDHAHRFMAATDAGDRATMLFDGRTASIPGAAFALASQIDNLDAHDGLNLTKGHIGCAVVPALCAFAGQRPDLSARDALIALVMAYETGARAGMALHASVSDYHTSGAWNALAVAALGARLSGLAPEALQHALGIAEYHGPRSQMMREIANPTMLHDGSGMGALVGAMAVLLAQDGFAGAPAITIDEAPGIWADLGQHWTVPENYIKPYPICRWAHASLDALAGLMEAHGFGPEAVARVDIRTFAEAAALFPDMPRSTSEAQYSLRFALAVLLQRGKIGPTDIMGQALRDRAVGALLPRIHIMEDARHSVRFPAARWSDVTVQLTDGRALSSGDVHARGGPEAPMDPEEISAKFARFAAPLGQARVTEIWSWRENLMRQDLAFCDFAALLHASSERGDV